MKARIVKNAARKIAGLERAAIRAALTPIVIFADRRVSRTLKRSS